MFDDVMNIIDSNECRAIILKHKWPTFIRVIVSSN